MGARAITGLLFIVGVASVVACSGSRESRSPGGGGSGAGGASSANANGGTSSAGGGTAANGGAAGSSSSAAGGGGSSGSGGQPAGLWVYRDGSFNWPLSNDYSYAVTSVTYTDTTGLPLSGAADIKIVTQPWGGWQPAAGVPLTQVNYDQDVSGMTRLTFALKPTVAGQGWTLFFHKVGDVYVYDAHGGNESVDVNSGAYGPAHPAPNVWSTYVVPLADVLTDYSANGVPGQGPPVLLTDVYKFAIADTTGATQTWFIDDVGFIP